MGASRTLGVVGAGQLGRMLHQAAVSHVIGPETTIRFLAEHPDEPAVQVAPSWEIGAAMSADDLTRFAKGCDVVTFEHEVVDLQAIRALERAGAVVRPSAAALAIVADKVAMRRAVQGAGLPVPPWCQVADADQLDDAIGRWPSVVLKLSRGGYDGRGVFMPDSADEAARIGRTLLQAGAVLLVEPRIAFEAEAAIIVARRPGGQCVVYDPVRTEQVDGQCREVRVPSGLAPAVAARCREVAIAAAAAVDVVGLLAVELFVLDGGNVVVNELAVRPHNTGHHTIDACVTSQFENHLRAVLDLPLGDPSLRCDAAVMVNVIGNAAGDDPVDHLEAALALDPAARIHLYGKRARPDRKLGHVTVCADEVDDAAARAWAVVAALHGDGRP